MLQSSIIFSFAHGGEKFLSNFQILPFTFPFHIFFFFFVTIFSHFLLLFFFALFPKPEGTEVETTYNSVLCASGKSHLFSKTFFAEVETKDKGGIKGL